MGTVIKKKVNIIPAKIMNGGNGKAEEKKQKVAAYCRVSTDNEEQDSSYEAQVEYYTHKIQENSRWKNAGIYADDGISGTNTKKRNDFNAMIKDALNGKIDLIITKSVSRFARNTVDSLTTIRKLKEKNIAVIFEKENVNTLDGSGELLITILSSMAQEESRNISENTRWGIIRKFENGKVVVNGRILGYRKNETGDLIVEPQEAETVKLIFRLYLEGYSLSSIRKYLEEKEIRTATGNDYWNDCVIKKILCNEKYMGDALLQKTYTVDFMTKKRAINNGVLPQYYVEDSHEAIIPKDLFYRVQEEMARRSSLCKVRGSKKKKQRSKYSSKYALTGILICGKCGYEYRRVTWSKNGKSKIVWRCTNRLENGKDKCSKSVSIEETALNNAVMEAVYRIIQNDGEFIDAFRKNVIRVIGNHKKENSPDEYMEKIKAKESEMVAVIEENARIGCYTQEFDDKYRRISEEVNLLKTEQKLAMENKEVIKNTEQRLQNMEIFIEEHFCQKLEFDNDLVRRLILNIKVVSSEKLLIQFASGIVLEQEIRYI